MLRTMILGTSIAISSQLAFVPTGGDCWQAAFGLLHYILAAGRHCCCDLEIDCEVTTSTFGLRKHVRPPLPRPSGPSQKHPRQLPHSRCIEEVAKEKGILVPYLLHQTCAPTGELTTLRVPPLCPPEGEPSMLHLIEESELC